MNGAEGKVEKRSLKRVMRSRARCLTPLAHTHDIPSQVLPRFCRISLGVVPRQDSRMVNYFDPLRNFS
jgi:hypothetical protein